MNASDITGPVAALVIVVVACGFAWRAFLSGQIVPGVLWDSLMTELSRLRIALERSATAQEKANEVHAAVLEELRRRLRDA